MTDKKYFGTDGIRGRVGGNFINPEFILKLGWATGRIMSSSGYSSVVIGRDTRISGYMLESALEAGFCAAGVDVLLGGTIPTPAVAYLTRTLHASGGVVITASHNPYHDNGIKFFDITGSKIFDHTESAIEDLLARPMQIVKTEELGKVSHIDNAEASYIKFCKSSVSSAVLLEGLRIVIDCAHGAACRLAPRVFSELGAVVTTIGSAPDGVNINLQCGATHMNALQSAVMEQSADLGIALDGDADRVMMVDHKGEIVDGDRIVYIIAGDRLRANKMKGPVVGTLMSNLGLEKAIKSLGLEFIREKVGDQHVIRRLHQESSTLGGEPSGHIICLDKASTGDGIIAALQVLSAMQSEGKSLADIAHRMTMFPQTLVNVSVPDILTVDALEAAQPLVIEAERQLNKNGRVLLRPSGTEPLIRVMAEGEEANQVQRVAEELAERVATMF